MSGIQSKFTSAITQRQPLLGSDNNTLRLFDGIGDGLDDTFLEAFANRWVISTHDDKLDSEVRAFLEASRKSVYWKRLDQHQKEDPVHLCGHEQGSPFLTKESGVKYEICFHSGYSQGLFLDQRENRKRVRAAMSEDKTLLNTFAYTGAFSVCGALGGATTTTLDLSQPYLEWAKRNMQANDIDPDQHYFCKGDTFHWLKRFAKQGRKFDGIILDPPTFSRDAKGKVFQVEAHYDQLVRLASQCLTEDGWILASTNCRKLSDMDFIELVKKGLPRSAKIESIAMPEEYTGESYLKSLWINI